MEQDSTKRGSTYYSPAIKFAPDTSLTDRSVRVIASDGTIDHVGDRLIPRGCDLSVYQRNNIVLFSHDATKPIGNAFVTITDTQVLARIEFAPKGASVVADETCALVKTGTLSAVSVGFEKTERQPNKSGGWDYLKWTLLEISIVAVPCNPNAVVVQRGLTSNSPSVPSRPKGVNRFSCCDQAYTIKLRQFIQQKVGRSDLMEGDAAQAEKYADMMESEIVRRGFVAQGHEETFDDATIGAAYKFIGERAGRFEVQRCMSDPMRLKRWIRFMRMPSSSA